MARYNYTINGVSLSETYKIHVDKVSGLLNMPGRLGKTEQSFFEQEGEDAFNETNEVYFKQRQIKVDCYLIANDNEDFRYLLGNFKEVLYGDQFVFGTPFGNYTCILKSGATVEFPRNQFDGSQNVSKFSLTFNEVEFQPTGTALEPESTTADVYAIDSIDLSRFGIKVLEARGHNDFTVMKKDSYTDYMSESKYVNTRQGRDIFLKCFMAGTSVSDFATKINQLYILLSSTGLRKLQIKTLPGTYNVYAREGVQLDYIKKYSDGVAAEFRLKLREPDPQIENPIYALLADTNGVYITTTSGVHIAVVGNRENLKPQPVFAHTKDEGITDEYIYTIAEFNEVDPDYNINAEKTYIYTKEETEQ